MSTTTLSVHRVDIRNADEREYRGLHEFQSRLELERTPEDPPTAYEQRVGWWRNTPPKFEHYSWVIWEADGSRVIADAGATIFRSEQNQHVLDFGIGVLPECRRRGLARQLLRAVVEFAESQQRRLLIAWTVDSVPAGEAFLLRLGAERGLEQHTNQLVIADVDTGLLDQWIERAQERAGDFELGFWTGPYPEAELPAIARLTDVMNSAPRGSLDVEDHKITPEMLREWEATMQQMGDERWSVYARERSSGALAGFSEVFWSPHRPTLLWQAATGVEPGFRNRGLGRWLKAAMLKRVLAERPGVQYIRTGNADSNAPMLHINHALGFKPFQANIVWQLDTARARAYVVSGL